MTFLLSTSQIASRKIDNLSKTREHDKVSILYDQLNYADFEEHSVYLKGEIHDDNGEKIHVSEIDDFQSPEDALSRVEGQFVLISVTDENFKVVRDFFGSEPIYYTQENGELYVSDRISCLLPFIDVEVNKEICRDYLRKGLIDHTQDTFFSGVKQLRPGEGILFNNSGLKIFKPGYSPDTELKIEELLKTEIKKNIPEDKFVCPVSGGLDSSILAAKSSKAAAEFFHVSFDIKTGDEDYYEALKQDLNLEVTELDLKISEIVENTGDLVKIQEEPVSMVSSGAQAFLYQKISQSNGEIPVLDGIGADELFYGYPMFLPFYVADCFRESFLTGFKALKEFLPDLGFTGAKKILKLAVSGEGLEDARERHLREFYFPHMLRFTAKNADSYGLTVRPVFLSQELAYKSSQVSPERNFAGSNTKMVLREAFREVLPPKLYDRREKTGFVHTSNELFGPEVWAVFEEVFSSRRFKDREFFDGEGFYQEFRDGVRNFAECYRYYCFEIWLREFIDQ